MPGRHIILPLLAVLSASACTVVLPAAPTPNTGTQPVFVSSGPAGKNPVIQSFTANPTNVTKGQPITFQVVAHDPNNEVLQFNWSATGGTLSATTGQALMWTPPEKPGAYTVMVTITNARGGVVTGSQNLTVQADGAAVIGAKDIAPSIVPAASQAPSAQPSPKVTATAPSPVPSTLQSPTLSASPSACSASLALPTIDYTSVDALFQATNIQALLNPTAVVTLSYHSISHTRYWVHFSNMAQAFEPNAPLPSHGIGSTSGDTQPDHVTQFKPFAGVVLLQFTPYHEGQPFNSNEAVIKNVLMNDCVKGEAMFLAHAPVLSRANWPGTFPDQGDGRAYAKGAFVFKLNTTDLDLGTFELP